MCLQSAIQRKDGQGSPRDLQIPSRHSDLVVLEPKKVTSLPVSSVSPSICHEMTEPDAMILVSWMLSFKPSFSLISFTFIKKHFSCSSLSAIREVSSAYQRLLIFIPAINSAYMLNKQAEHIQP